MGVFWHHMYTMSKKRKKKDEFSQLARLSPMEWGLLILVMMLTSLAVLVSVDPNRRLNEATNAHRFSDVTSILDDVLDFKRDTGVYPNQVLGLNPEYAYEIGTCLSGASCSAVTVNEVCVDLNEIGTVPVDPAFGTDLNSGYYIILHKNDEVTVGACSPDPEGATGDGPTPAINLRD